MLLWIWQDEWCGLLEAMWHLWWKIQVMDFSL
jgi:hypothetical protein